MGQSEVVTSELVLQESIRRRGMLEGENIREKVPRCVRQLDLRLWVSVWEPGKGAGGSECWLVIGTLSVRLRSVNIV